MNIGSGTRVSDWTTMVVDSSCNQMDYMIKHFYYLTPALCVCYNISNSKRKFEKEKSLKRYTIQQINTSTF